MSFINKIALRIKNPRIILECENCKLFSPISYRYSHTKDSKQNGPKCLHCGYHMAYYVEDLDKIYLKYGLKHITRSAKKHRL